MPGFKRVDHISLTVPDARKAAQFYCDVFGATALYELGPFDARDLPAQEDGSDWTDAHIDVPDARLEFAVVEMGGLNLEFTQYERPADVREEAPRNCDPGGHHIGLEVDDIAIATAYLAENRVHMLAGPIEIPTEAPSGGMLCRYFADPWGNQLELIQRT